MKTDKLDQIIESIRGESPAPELASEAVNRVHARLFQSAPELSTERLRNCADFQVLIPAWLNKSLSPARSLLLMDHTHSCVECRHALDTARTGNLRVLPRPATVPNHISPITRWAVAAVLVLGVGFGTWGLVRALVVPAGVRASVQAVHGTLYKVADRASTPIYAGRDLGEGEAVRTAKGSTATLRLSDGSLIEMNERSELSVSRASHLNERGATIHLNRGNIIVQAAKQRNGTLNVLTADYQVAVKGTIFAVTSGTKGSRVSVIEGKVQVSQGGQSKLLAQGQQADSNAAVVHTPVQDDIAWSQNAARYLTLLGDAAAIQKGLDQLPSPAVRTSSKLLNYAPYNTVVYAAIPNIGTTLDEANRLFEDRMQQSPVLKQWWEEQQASNKGPNLQDLVQKIHTASSYLGDEIVVALAGEDWQSKKVWPVVMAEVKLPGLREYLGGVVGDKVRFVDNATLANGALQSRDREVAVSKQPLVYATDTFVAISPDLETLRAVAGQLAQPSNGPSFSNSQFYTQIQKSYQGGATWLFCANLEQMRGGFVRFNRMRPARNTETDATGFSDVRYLLLERKDVNGETKNQATLTFRSNRSGLASWLAAPAPMGSLDFVSPDASLAASFVIKNPGQLLSEFVSNLEAGNPEAAKEINDFQAKSGVNIIQDLADPLGGELTFALDGPLVPIPSWKLAVELYNPDRLQWGIDHLIAAFNQQAAADRKVTLKQEQTGGRTFYTLSAANIPYEINYTYVDSYLVAAPSRALLTSAIQNRQTGYTLVRSQKFQAQLPKDANPNFSAIIYHDFSSSVNAVVDQLKSSNALSGDHRQAIAALQASAAPGLFYAYGESDRITLAAHGSLPGFNLNTLALPMLLKQVMPHVAAPQGRVVARRQTQ